MRLGRFNLIAAVSTAAIAASSVAFAQSKATAPAMPDDVTVTSPRWNQSSGSNSHPLAGPDELLTKTVMAVPQAKADAVVARWTYSRLNQQLNLTSNYLQRDFHDSPEYDQALTEFQDAYDAYDLARVNALAGLRQDAKYQAAQSLRDNVSEQIADEHGQKEPNRTRLASLAELKIDSMTPFREQERDALAADQNVAGARSRLVAAGKTLAKLEKNFARQHRDHPELAELRKSREDARIAMLASAAYLDESRMARNFAIRYAYLSRRVDRYVPRLGDYGYGYGYSGYGRYGYGGIGVINGGYRYGGVRYNGGGNRLSGGTIGTPIVVD